MEPAPSLALLHRSGGAIRPALLTDEDSFGGRLSPNMSNSSCGCSVLVVSRFMEEVGWAQSLERRMKVVLSLL